MKKQDLLIELMIVIAAMQNIAVDLVEENEYTDFNAFMDDILSNMSEETPTVKRPQQGIFGIVDKEKAMQEIGDNHIVSIFGDENGE